MPDMSKKLDASIISEMFISVILMIILVPLPARANEPSLRHYIVPVSRNVAEALKIIETESGYKLNEILIAYGVGVLDQNTARVSGSDEKSWCIEFYATHRNAMTLMRRLHDLQYDPQGRELTKDQIITEMRESVNHPGYKSVIEEDRKLNKELEIIRNKYKQN
jgi:hypothetical protein